MVNWNEKLIQIKKKTFKCRIHFLFWGWWIRIWKSYHFDILIAKWGWPTMKSRRKYNMRRWQKFQAHYTLPSYLVYLSNENLILYEEEPSVISIFLFNFFYNFPYEVRIDAFLLQNPDAKVNIKDQNNTAWTKLCFLLLIKVLSVSLICTPSPEQRQHLFGILYKVIYWIV